VTQRFAGRALAGLMFLVGAALGSQPAAAHPHHDTPMTYEEALGSAVLVVDDLITQKHIEPSWKGIWPVTAERAVFQGQMLWVVILKNPAIPDPAKQTLYVIFDHLGEFVVANHTGTSN
jgi:hypothetical protein